jgi:hypothetical protein
MNLRVKTSALLQWDNDPELMNLVERVTGGRVGAAYVVKIVAVCPKTNTAAIEVRWRHSSTVGLVNGRIFRLPINPRWVIRR